MLVAVLDRTENMLATRLDYQHFALQSGSALVIVHSSFVMSYLMNCYIPVFDFCIITFVFLNSGYRKMLVVLGRFTV